MPVPACNNVFTWSSTLSFVKYKLELPSATESVLNEMFALPLKLTPLIVLAVSKVVAVVALPVKAPANVLDAVILIPVVIKAELAAFLIFNTLLDVSTHN